MERKSANEIIEEYKNGERDFRELDLRGESFAKEDLSRANFRECNLSGANFRECNLSGANFKKSNLFEADFTRATLKGTNFAKAKLRKAKLCGIEAGNENEDMKFTWFLSFLLTGVGLIIIVILVLLISRQSELDLINKNANSFLSLAILVPVGYYIHLSESDAKMAHIFWSLGTFGFWLKTFDQPLLGLLGNFLFWGLAASLLSPFYKFWIRKHFLFDFYEFWINNFWWKLGKLVFKSSAFIISTFFAIVFVLISFFRFDSSEIISFFRLDLPDQDNWLLILGIITLSLPVIPSFFLSMAAYSVLFDANKLEIYKNFFKAFLRLLVYVIVLIFSYTEFQYIWDENYFLLPIFYLIISLLLIPVLQFIILELLQSKKLLILKWALFLICSGLFWIYYYYVYNQNEKNNLSFLISIIPRICLLSFLLLLTYTFSTLSFNSKRPTKLLSGWYFLNFSFPVFIISIPGFLIDNTPSWTWLHWALFFLPFLGFWLLFLWLLSISISDINNLNDFIKNILKFCRLIVLIGLGLYLVFASFTIIMFFVYLLENKNFVFWFFQDSFFDIFFEQFVALFVTLFGATLFLSTIFWLILLPAKSKIAETKQQNSIKPQYSGFRDLAVFIRCIDSTKFWRANLREADFSDADVKGVNFRGAFLKRTIWTRTQGLEGAAVGNTYLKYQKVRNWVVQVEE